MKKLIILACSSALMGAPLYLKQQVRTPSSYKNVQQKQPKKSVSAQLPHRTAPQINRLNDPMRIVAAFILLVDGTQKTV